MSSTHTKLNNLKLGWPQDRIKMMETGILWFQGILWVRGSKLNVNALYHIIDSMACEDAGSGKKVSRTSNIFTVYLWEGLMDLSRGYFYIWWPIWWANMRSDGAFIHSNQDQPHLFSEASNYVHFRVSVTKTSEQNNVIKLKVVWRQRQDVSQMGWELRYVCLVIEVVDSI